MGVERDLLSHSPEATEELARRLGAVLEAGAVVALSGELGTGKTRFVRGLALGLGAVERVSSPTYTLMHEYPGRLTLYHFDAWMEGRERAFLEGGGAEWIGAGGVAVVEWAERVAAWLPEPRIEVLLEHRGPDRRRLRLRVRPGPAPEAAGGALERMLADLTLPGGVEELS